MSTERQVSEAGATRATTLVSQLRSSIMRGDYEPGARLHLDSMRKAFDVSFSPLREALCRLESEGLVRIEDQRGYRVAPVSAATWPRSCAYGSRWRGWRCVKR